MSRLPIHIVLVIIALLTQTGFAMETTANAPIELPPRDKLLDTLRKDHPRLIALDADIDRVRKLIDADPLAEQWCDRLRKEAQEILNEPPPTYEIPDGLRLLSTSRRVVSRIYRLGLFYRLDGDRRYADRAWQELDAAANFPDWNPRHFLDTAEMAHAFAIGYDWFYSHWTPDQRAALRAAMIKHGLNPALESYRTRTGHGWWTTCTHNWNQVCNGGITLAALAIADDEPQIASEILSNSLRLIQGAMAQYAPDGGCAEGPGYWHYATDYNVVMLAGLESALGTDFGLSRIPGFSEAGMFPIYMNGPLDKSFNYADAGEGLIRAHELFWLARKFNQPAFARYQRHAANLQVRDLLWMDSPGELRPQRSQPPAPELPLDKYFRGVEAASFRSSWNDTRATFVGFKAGDNKANHSNLDLGSFVLDALGCRWALDLGPDNYNMPGYFGKQRWDYYRMRTEGHNALVINPATTANQDTKAAAKIARFESNPGHAFAIADLTAAYAAQSVRRGIALTANRRRVLIQDEVKLPEPGEIWWFMHTKAAAEIADDGRTAMLRQGQPRLWLRILSPQNASFTVMDARPLPASPNPEMQNKNEGVRKLAIRLADARNVTISVLMVPLEQNEQPPAELPDVKPLSEW